MIFPTASAMWKHRTACSLNNTIPHQDVPIKQLISDIRFRIKTDNSRLNPKEFKKSWGSLLINNDSETYVRIISQPQCFLPNMTFQHRQPYFRHQAILNTRVNLLQNNITIQRATYRNLSLSNSDSSNSETHEDTGDRN